ncbi:MAG: ferrous iron transporter B [Clostridia bacterium]|nr:ferrous iron transporter B [Clostridia bacterium]
MENVRILLVGNPNAGKSTLFNALTHGHARVGNWHGVTVGALEGKAKLGGKRVTVCDLPGIYTVEGTSMEERYACDYVLSHPNDRVLFVSECATLARSLPLFAALCKGRKAALVLTKRRAFERAGGKIDAEELARRLKIDVIDADKGKRAVKKQTEEFLAAPKIYEGKGDAEGIFTPPKIGLSKADNLLLNGWFAFPLFFLLLFAAFFLTFARHGPGDFLKSCVERFFCDFLAGKAESVASPVLRSFLCDGILSGLGGVLCFLPQIALLYTFLIVLEESGLFSRLAVLCDGFCAKIGLSGRAVFSLLLGFGCTAAAVASTRSLDDKRVQRRTILCLPYIACSAKLPVFLTLSASFFSNPFVSVVLLYALGAGIGVGVSVFLKRDAPLFVLELAPLQIPRPLFVAKTLLFQLKQFIIKVTTVVLAFFLFSWVLSSFDFSFRLAAQEDSMLAHICSVFSFLFAPAGMNDWRIAYCAFSGLIAKENIAGSLAMFYETFPYSPQSAFAFSVFVLTCSPCVAAIAATAKELGVKRALLYAFVQTGTALLACYFTYFALTGGAFGLLAPVLLALILILVRGKKGEKLHRKRKRNSQRVHR